MEAFARRVRTQCLRAMSFRISHGVSGAPVDRQQAAVLQLQCWEAQCWEAHVAILQIHRGH